MSTPQRNPEFDLACDAMLDGATVVEASAGTGKTWTIERIVLARVLQGVPMPRIALMSFTRAAADELAERVRGTLHAAMTDSGTAPAARGLLERALLDFDAACISTIHGFCQRMLQEHAAEAGVLGLAGWTLDPDCGGSERLALADAYSATALRDPVWCELARAPSELAHALSKALQRSRDRERVASADFTGAMERWRTAVPGVHAAGRLVQGLQVLAEHSNKKQRDASVNAVAAVTAWQQGNREDQALAMAATRALSEVNDALWDESAALQGAPKNRAAARSAIEQAHRAFMQSCAADLEALVRAWQDACRQASDAIVRRALEMLAHRRAQRRQFDYQDLLHRLRAGLHAADGALLRAIRSRFDVAILDEFQDTDPVQADIVRMLFRHAGTSLYLVGDPKQSIYGFRSADLDSYLEIRRAVPTRRSLSVSHRSDRRLVEAVNTLFAVPAPFFHAEVVAEPVRSAFPERRLRRKDAQDPAGMVLHAVPGSVTVAGCALIVAQAIRRQLQQGWTVRVKASDPWRSLEPSDIAVLCRTHLEMRTIASALREWHVPCVVLGGDNVFESEMAGELAGVLLALARPSQRGLALAAAGSRMLGLSQLDLASNPDGLAQRFRMGASVLERSGVVAGLRELLRTVGQGLDGLASEPDGERHLADLAQLLELLDQAECSGIRGAPALAAWMAEQVRGQRSGDDQAQKVRALAEHDAVTLQTLHGSKGLTYGMVWLPSAMRAGGGDDDAAQVRASAAEARRLLYVGLTRARWQAHALWRHDSRHAHAALATLLHARGEEDSDAAASLAKDRLKSADFATCVRDLRGIADASDGSIEVRMIDEGSAGAPIEPSLGELVEALPAPVIPRAAQQVSFTSLHARFGETEAGDGVDRDDPALRGAESTGAATGCDAALRALGLAGTALGNLVHEALEQPDVFRGLAAGGSCDPLARAIADGMPGDRAHAPDVLARAAASIRLALGVTVEGIPSVAAVAGMDRGVFRELKLAAAWQGGLRDLADAFERDPAPWAAPFARTLREGDGHHLHGILVGNIDLAVLHQDRWFLYDYKTNDCGRGGASYSTIRAQGRPSALDEAMIRSRYPLQAALYATLVRRWARARGCGDRASIAGVAYLFLRGIEPGRGDQGVWHWQPSDALLDAVDTHLVSEGSS
jgi:exodeoxyribonuclease V beta subunit